MNEQKAPATTPMRSAEKGCTKPEAGVMATRPATAPEIAPRAVGLPLWIHSAMVQPKAAAAAAKCVLTKALVASGPEPSALPGVESEPAHPQQASADKAEDHGVGRHVGVRIAEALAEINRSDECGDAGGDVNDGPAGEVEAGNMPPVRIQQAADAPDHMRHRAIDEQRPQRKKDGHGAELHALGESAGDECRGDDGEHELVDHVGLFGNGGA